jgi:hypothetical protein
MLEYAIKRGVILCVMAHLGAVTPVLADVAQMSAQGPHPAVGAQLPWPVKATLSDPTERYPHKVLGRIPAFTSLTVTAEVCTDCAAPQITAALTLDAPLVFEDVAPRLWDVTGDGRPEVVVVQSHESLGARLTVWALRDPGQPDAPLFRMLAATDFIGTRFRWLAPFGLGDFTGDGQIEIAYVETPHLGKTLRLVGLDGDRLVERAALSGVTNHRIGEESIAGGVRFCDGRSEAVLASADRQRLVAIQWIDGSLVSQDIGPLRHAGDWDAAMICP